MCYHLKQQNLKAMKQKVQFNSDGLVLVGNLYTPTDFDQKKKYPAVVVGGSLTSVKEQMSGTYAEKLAEHDIVALAFDYRNFGESEGQPRQYEDPALKSKDLQSAVTFLLSLPYVRGVGALGVCTTGGNVAYLAAEDDRIKAIATVVAWLPDADVLPMLYGSEDNIEALRKAGAEAKKEFAISGNNKIIPAYSNTDKSASHVGPMEYYMDKTRGGGVKEWKNEFAVMSWESWLDFDPIPKATTISTPFMMFHSDGCALPDNAKKFYNLLKGEKELVWGDGYHFDYYDQPKQVAAAVEKVSAFFKNQLIKS
ncbi:alpha/beta hydrolase [Flavitalea antarctica]